MSLIKTSTCVTVTAEIKDFGVGFFDVYGSCVLVDVICDCICTVPSLVETDVVLEQLAKMSATAIDVGIIKNGKYLRSSVISNCENLTIRYRRAAESVPIENDNLKFELCAFAFV